MTFDYEDSATAERRRRWLIAMQEAMAVAAWKPALQPRASGIEEALVEALDMRVATYYAEKEVIAARAEARRAKRGRALAVVLVIATILVGWYADWHFGVGESLSPAPAPAIPTEIPNVVPVDPAVPGGAKRGWCYRDWEERA